MSFSFRHAIGVDLSATNTTVIIANSMGEIDSERKRETDKSSIEAPVKQVIEMAEECLDEFPVRPDIYGIGVSCIGPYDTERGGILRTPNIDFDFVPVREPLRQAFPGRNFIRGGDCFGAVHAEAEYGLGQGKENVVYVTMSTGIGGGVIVDGKALVGMDGDAGHIGHFTVDSSPHARKCGCRSPNGKKRKGHWEAYGSGTAVAEITRSNTFGPGCVGFPGLPVESKRLVLSTTHERLNRDAEIDAIMAEDLYVAARKQMDYGPLRCLIDGINFYNTIGFAAVTDAYNPEIIIVGGSMMEDDDLILHYVRENLPNHAILTPPEIVKTNLGSRNVALGGIAMLSRYGGEKL